MIEYKNMINIVRFIDNSNLIKSMLLFHHQIYTTHEKRYLSKF